MAAWMVSHVTQTWIVPALLIGWIIVEYAEAVSRFITQRLRFALAYLVGMYGGVLGAGVSLLIVGLLRLETTDQGDIYKLRAHALLLETFFTSMAVLVFIFQGLVHWEIASVWIAGALIGGYIGGHLLAYTGKLSGALQQNILRAAFIFALAVAVGVMW